MTITNHGSVEIHVSNESYYPGISGANSIAKEARLRRKRRAKKGGGGLQNVHVRWNRNKSHETREPGFPPRTKHVSRRGGGDGEEKNQCHAFTGFIFTGEQAEEVGDSGEKASRQWGKRARTQKKEEEEEERKKWGVKFYEP